jgi:hypothetical protein
MLKGQGNNKYKSEYCFLGEERLRGKMERRITLSMMVQFFH